MRHKLATVGKIGVGWKETIMADQVDLKVEENGAEIAHWHIETKDDGSLRVLLVNPADAFIKYSEPGRISTELEIVKY